ncbi:hypothetical protein ACTPMS_003008 [Acinetobacter baumannii]
MKKNAVITITAVFLDHIGKITNPYMDEKEKKFYWFHGQDEITKPHILSWIKSIESLKEVKAESQEI